MKVAYTGGHCSIAYMKIIVGSIHHQSEEKLLARSSQSAIPCLLLSLYFCPSLLKAIIKCVKNSSASCCLIVANSLCPFPISALKLAGFTPAWKTGIGDGCWSASPMVFSVVEWAGWEYRSLRRPSATLHIWNSTQSARRATGHVLACPEPEYCISNAGREKIICRTEAKWQFWGIIKGRTICLSKLLAYFWDRRDPLDQVWIWAQGFQSGKSCISDFVWFAVAKSESSTPQRYKSDIWVLSYSSWFLSMFEC